MSVVEIETCVIDISVNQFDEEQWWFLQSEAEMIPTTQSYKKSRRDPSFSTNSNLKREKKF